MKQWARVAMLMATLLAIAVAAAPASAAKPDTVPGLPVQLSLGDSWAFGFGATVPSEGGYVPRLHTALQDEYDCLPAASARAQDGCKHLQLVNVAVGGATTPTLIANQLPGATELLESRNGDANPRNDVEIVTLHIGGNDVTNPIIAACLGGITPSCIGVIESEFAAYRSDLDDALSALRDAAGPDARIVIGTYDNGIAQCFLTQINPAAPLLADIVLENQPPVLPGGQGLHDIMRDVGADYGVEVAEVFGDLAPQDWVGGNDCLHPVDSGYQKVADAFLEVLAS
jgi:lysophospholipase L1-like esterase